MRSALALLLLAGPAFGQTPPPTPDALVADVVAKRTAEAGAVQARKDAEAAVLAWDAEWRKKMADLGLTGPVPPAPTPPNPVPPAPVDPLVAKLKAAYVADAGLNKAAVLADLTELMKQAATLAADPTVTTIGGLAGKVGAAANTLAKNQLVGVWAIVKAEIAAAMPNDGPLSTDARALAGATFTKLQAALVEAGK